MNISYLHDLDANYLVIEDESFCPEKYTLRMLEKNAPGSFLKLSLKQMNGVTILRYRITSMQPLERIYERRTMSGQDIRAVLDGFDSLIGDIRLYLLETDDVVFDPSCIFMSPDRKVVRFIYVPGQKELLGSSLKQLSEFILKKLDHKDPVAVEAGYGLYDRVAGGEEDYIRIGEELRRNLEEHEMAQENSEMIPETGNEVPIEKAPSSPDQMIIQRRPVRRGYVVLGICGGILTAAAFALYIWLGDPDLTQIGGLFFGTLALVWLIISLVQNRREEKVNTGKDMDETDEEEFWNALAHGEDDTPGEKTGSGRDKDRSRPEKMTMSETEETWIHGETRALGDVDRRNRLVLVSQDIRRCRDLTVESAISLIGKSRDTADVCIPLDVVSRVHARLDFTQEGIYLTDLNSMNGTFVNEKRLAPNQRVPVKEGDLISFATVHFKLARRDY